MALCIVGKSYRLLVCLWIIQSKMLRYYCSTSASKCCTLAWCSWRTISYHNGISSDISEAHMHPTCVILARMTTSAYQGSPSRSRIHMLRPRMFLTWHPAFRTGLPRFTSTASPTTGRFDDRAGAFTPMNVTRAISAYN